MKSIDKLCINAIRFLSVDQVEAAKSGHPGLPLGAAPMAFVLWDRFLRHNPANPTWFDRDRFILSAGHGSALIYSLLHLYGYDLPLDELRNFRQWGSKTPGHPEYGHTPGVECTTGPLGQGFTNGVGMAIAEAHLAATFNDPGEAPVVDHYTYGICSDGDLMEGIASEAASLAGHLKLGKLIYLYDDNHISIDGDTKLAFTEDVPKRFESYGWHVQGIDDGNDLQAIEAAIKKAQSASDRPSLIRVRTHIGYGSPKQDTAAAHGAALGPEGVLETKKKLGWPAEPTFHIPEEVAAYCSRAADAGGAFEATWKDDVAAYRERSPEKAKRFEDAVAGRLPDGWEKGLPVFAAGEKPMATRAASGKVINSLIKYVPTLIGGSADLTESNLTHQHDKDVFNAETRSGTNFHFGVREHAMGAAVNGMALHGGVRPYGATFLIFSDYMRASIRLSALMNIPSIFVFTHDSVGLGEDGPTHQPIEHLMSLRLIPNLTVIRPADPNETVAAWRWAIQHDGPVALALTRQGLPTLDVGRYPIAKGLPRGAYTLAEAPSGRPDVVLIATGSEVSTIMEAQEALEKKGVQARVVSMPSWELFDAQPDSYRREVLPGGIPRLAIEAGSSRGWRDYVGEKGDIIGIDRFGASAPGGTVLKNLGIRADHVVDRTMTLLGR
ncbi:MAG: transketolase [bacterium]|nr:transketolase [bacterium]